MIFGKTNMKLQGKVAVITGGSKGIGLGCARVFTKHGCAVVLAARTVAAGQAVAADLTEAGHTAEFVRCDVTSESDLRSLIDGAAERFGRLDCIVNNAGWHPPEMTIDQISVEDFECLVRLNLTSTFMGCKFAVPHLSKTQGSIVNMSSEVGLQGQEAATSYAATKAGQIGLTKALAIDLAPVGVRVNVVCPAGVMTPLMQEWAETRPDPAAALRQADQVYPMGRIARIEEIGEVCAFLASQEAPFITGQAICPDGGFTLGYRR